jgi:ketosteroid isomerase-like protein
MSEQNVQTLRRWADAAKRGDLAAAEAELHPDGVEIDDRDIIESTGADSHRVWLERWNAAWDRWETEEQATIPVGEQTVLALFRIFVTGKESGIDLARDDALVAKFRDGKIVRFAYYTDQAQARREAGLAE